MNNTEIKKVLYKEKPLATLHNSDSKNFHYMAETSVGTISFQVPTSEMGETSFESDMPAQLLIRWLVAGVKAIEIENPPAFAAISADGNDLYQQDGMSLRDYFAAKAMNGVLSNSTTMNRIASEYSNGVSETWAIAAKSYQIADEMLKQRSKHE